MNRLDHRPNCVGCLVCRLGPARLDELVERYKAGESTTALAAAFESNTTSVLGLLRKVGVRIRSSAEGVALHRARSETPTAAGMALSIRREHRTVRGLSLQYDISESRIRAKLNDAGYSTVTGESTVKPVEHRTSPLHLSAGGSGHYVGGGDHDKPLPRCVKYAPPKPKPRGLDWAKLRPADQPLTPDPTDVEMVGQDGDGRIHTFRPDPELEGVRDPSGNFHELPDWLADKPKPARGGAGNRLTAAQRAEICTLYKSGESLADLGKIYDVSPTAIKYSLTKLGVPLRTRSEAMRLAYHK